MNKKSGQTTTHILLYLRVAYFSTQLHGKNDEETVVASNAVRAYFEYMHPECSIVLI